MAENTWFAATPGDTVLGTIRNTYGRLPQVEIDRMLEEFERLNKRPARDIKAGEHYILPSSTWHRGQVGERFGPDELLEVISAGAAYRNKALGRVNAWRELTGLSPATFTPSNLASSLRSYSTATDKDIQDRIVSQALAAGIDRIEDLDPWFTRRGYDKVFLKGAADALRARLGEQRTAELQTGKVARQAQEIDKANTRTIIRKGQQVPQVRNEESDWEWIDDPVLQSYPRFKPDAPTVPTVRQFYEDNKIVFKQYDPEDDTWKKVPGTEAAPRWQTTDAAPVHRTIKRDGKEIVQNWDKDKEVWVDAEEAPRWKEVEKSARHNNWEEWVVMENTRRREASEEELTKAELAESYRKFVLTEQAEVTEPTYQLKSITALMDKKESFLATSHTINRMLNQLADPEVVLGGIGSIISGFANITGQWTQLATTLGEKRFLDHELYKWGRAAKGDQIRGNITALAYSLARAAEESGGRLAKEDVQMQVDRLSGSLQSKNRFAAALFEVHNETLSLMEHKYKVSKDAKVPGTERSWEEYLAYAGTGKLMTFTHGAMEGVGYEIFVIDEDGNKRSKIQPIAMWSITE